MTENGVPERGTATENRVPERDGVTGEIAYLSFTARGRELSEVLRAALGGEASCTRDVSLARWTAENFPYRRALVYVGAVGIAVRAIAPYLRSKATDPAVVAVDECGRFAVPLASGHLGGANELASKIAALTGGTAVITTATDLRGVFAVDEWARRHDCAVIHPTEIKSVSGKLLAGGTVRFYTAFPVDGAPPDGVELITPNPPPDGAEVSDTPDGVKILDTSPDVWLDVHRHPPLSLSPRVLVLGVGCRRGTAPETLERRFSALCEHYDLWPDAFAAAATIDLKAGEPGLLAFCAAHGWELHTFRADELRQVPGTFTASAFVARRTGVENVCERAAVLLSKGELLVRKRAGEGVTFAVARRPVRLDWSW
ncbi:MAG: cobalamin biosynthesis protein [Oscillibacter sp.]|nr:cobalamin biosynthesis protein [Oscillibacter sp.]